MKENNTLGLYVSLISVIGVPLLFLVLSIATENWLFFLFSLIPAFAGGLSLLVTVRYRKKNVARVE